MRSRAVPFPPAGLPRGMRARGDEPAGDPPHFFRGNATTFAALDRPRRVRLRDGSTIRATHEVRWFLDRVRGVGRREALRRLYDVLLHPAGWTRAGVHFRRVSRREEATLLVRVIPSAETACGKGAAGCYSWGDGLPVAEVGVELIGDEGPWQVVVGMEVCAHPLSMDDMYTREHQPYRGVLGGWEGAAAVGFVPTRAETGGMREWAAGTVDPRRVHH